LAYEVLAANTNDNRTLRDLLGSNERLYGQPVVSGSWSVAFPPKRCWPRCARPIRRCIIWWAHRRTGGLADEVATTSASAALEQARLGAQVELLTEDNEHYVFAESEDRVATERVMRMRQLKWLRARLKQLTDEPQSEELLNC
jgi:hypothetical protein